MDFHHRAQPLAPRVLLLLPWVFVLIVSTSFAYAMNVAVGGAPTAQLAQADVSPAPTSADLSAGSALFYDEEVEAVCDRAPCRRVRRWLPTTTGSRDTTVTDSRTLP